MEEKTAVEWLYDKIKHGITKKQFDEFILRSKEMEKEQIKDAYVSGFDDLNLSAEGYYNKIYKK